MRRLSAAMVALTATIALMALAAPAWTAPKPVKTTERALAVSPTQVRPGQMVKVSGGGCRGITVLIFYVDGQSFHRGMTKSGDWSYQVKLPTSVKAGNHDLRAQCTGTNFKPARFHISHSHKVSFDVSPDTIHAGGKVHADGNGCRRKSRVRIKLDGDTIAHFYADRHGNFDRRVRIPKGTKRGRHVASAVCGHRFIGADGIKIKKKYHDGDHHHGHHHRHHGDHMKADHSVVKPGGKVRLRGDDCPDGVASASLDGTPVALKVAHSDGGFTATATLPKGTAPGKHQLYAGCDAGSSGTTELNVLDPEATATAVERRAFAPQQSSDLAMWAGLFAGLSLLVASAVFTTRRRGNRG